MNAHNDVVGILGKLLHLARERRPEDRLLRSFLARLFRDLPDDDVDDQRLEDAYGAAVAQLELARVRYPGQTLVQVLSPEAVDRAGWESDRSILMFVTDDVPFLVDSVRMVLERREVGIHLLVHPMLAVERDSAHRVQAFGHHVGPIEAWTLIEIDRCLPADAAQLEVEVHVAIEGVQLVVADFTPMRERLASVAGQDELLAWLVDDRFVFLGAVSYVRRGDDLELVPGSELGEFRSRRVDPTIVDPPSLVSDDRVVFARTDAVAEIHRDARMTSIAVRPDGVAEGAVEHRFVGLLGSAAYRESVFAIPVVSNRARAVLDRRGALPNTYTGRAVQNVVETLPRDVMFELGVGPLTGLVDDIVGLQERPIVRVFDVGEPVGPWTTVFVYLPRSRFHALLPERVAALVGEHYRGETRDLEVLLGSSSLARISLAVRAGRLPSVDALVDAIDATSTTWRERLRRALIAELGEIEGLRLFGIVEHTVPADYEAGIAAADAVATMRTVAAMLDPIRIAGGDVASVETDIVRAGGRFGATPWRFRVFLRDRPAAISELVPILEHLGLSPVDERPYVFAGSDGVVYLYDIGVEFSAVDVESDRFEMERIDEVRRSFVGLLRGTIEADGLNRLILAAGLTGRQVAVLRLYNRYLHQVGFTFSTRYVEQALARNTQIVRGLVDVFDARFDPKATDGVVERTVHVASVRAQLDEQLDAVPSLDDDRICRAFLALIDATTRTNAFIDPAALAVKLIPTALAFVPAPRPEFEIFVCSAAVEGVHLRGGRIARGGLRWSDRPEDFRTEVLGLVKAQMVKNAVIVPTGAKGGFVVKAAVADPSDRDAVRAEGIDRYRRFVGALLDVTDNVVDGAIVHPRGVVVYDGDDPYLVVAADKGTATFSDIANAIAAERDFWLGDAFASGGSHGYDHKEMGITARGAWESVRRHAHVLGLDADRDELTVVGIGDMSGDVFGNGMLRSPHIRLVAAFDHRHVFLDPSPDPAITFAERQRLFGLARSSWADYDRGLISAGGGVYSRAVKSVELTPEARAVLGLDGSVTGLSPDELISAILAAPVDLLWNGGIGTYVKASTETHGDVGDRANDAVRIDARDLRARMVGEGGNLGFTQLARVEYAIGGGLIYTDAIDNSAGVDCSDHEVNIKIVLESLVRSGRITAEERNALLVEMTDEVAELVLRDNRAQTLALMIARTQSLMMVNVHARYLDTLEAEGWLDRRLEFLPTDKQIAERQSAGSGLRAPEFAVMIAYTKNADVTEILESDLPDDTALDVDLLAYFPTVLRERFPDAIREHRLRREIVATRVVNSMVNLAGISFDHRMTEDSGASVSDVARAFVAAREIFGFAEIWDEIDALGSSVSAADQIELFLDARRMAERGAGWLLRNRRPPLAIGDAVDTFGAGLAFLAESLDSVVTGRVGDDIERLRSRWEEAGVPAPLAVRAARFPWMHTGFDIVEIAHREATNVADAATAYWSVFDAFDLGWLWDGIGRLPRSDRWQTQARSALRDDLMTTLADLTRLVMDKAGGSPAAWIAANERAVGRALAMHTEIRRADSFDLTTLSVALRQLRNLTLTAVAPKPQ